MVAVGCARSSVRFAFESEEFVDCVFVTFDIKLFPYCEVEHIYDTWFCCGVGMESPFFWRTSDDSLGRLRASV